MSAKDKILVAAGELFSQQDITLVSQRQILQAAGQRNTSAIQYHFGSREGLLRAVFERGVGRIDDRRNQILDELEATGRQPQIEDYINALVRPLCEQRDDGESGIQTLRFLNQVLRDPNLRLMQIMKGIDSGMRRAHQGVVHCLPDIPPLLLRYRLYAGSRASSGVLCDWDRNRKLDALSDVFTDDLVAMVLAMVTAPVSPGALEKLADMEPGSPENLGYTAPARADA
ncbi:MAG: TetR family transcriptional regulator [Minwuia sp.]|nr:TetR family transcriptional regulator [Minwuia sp.]